MLKKRLAEEDWVRYGVSGRRKRNQGRLERLRGMRTERREQLRVQAKRREYSDQQRGCAPDDAVAREEAVLETLVGEVPALPLCRLGGRRPRWLCLSSIHSPKVDRPFGSVYGGIALTTQRG